MSTILIIAAILIVGFVIYQFVKTRDAGISEPGTGDASVYEDVLLSTLAMMTYADTNTKTVEVEQVRAVYKDLTGKDVSESDVRVASRSEFLDDTTVDKFLAKSADKLDDGEKRQIMSALATIMRADDDIRPGEADFFNKSAEALGLSAADVADLTK